MKSSRIIIKLSTTKRCQKGGLKKLKQVKVILSTSEVTNGYMTDDENVILFYHNSAWLCRIQQTNKNLYEVISPMAHLGIQKRTTDLEQYANKIMKIMKNNSLYDYIVQKHYHLPDQDINFDIS